MKYTEAEMEIVMFEGLDVITTSEDDEDLVTPRIDA